MKRVWVKKDQMYFKPFYKQKLKMSLLLVILMAVVFFSYQIFCMNQLDEKSLEGSGHRVYKNNNVHYDRFQSVAEAINK